ncbi:MAG: alpha/beta hydrolase [Methyloprofundus sp.]|nr:alpha/beta hydrolase [Methyloprofundus sp.]MBW6452203.1 alpha/beta hydrolase [Methyloprofundus sp.]
MSKNKAYFVLIRGLLREQRHWGEFTPLLAQQFPAAEIVTLDIPGNGSLHQETSPNTIAGLTEALRVQLEGKKNMHLIALSMGAMIAIDWMNRHPLEINSAVLINTSVRPYSPFFQRLRWQNYPRLVSMLFKSAEQRERDILALTANLHQQDTRLLADWQKWCAQYPVSKISAINQLQAAAQFLATNKPAHPLLIISAKNDRLVDYRCSVALHKAWHCDYLQHASAGHDLPLDDPKWLAQTIEKWLVTN